MIMIKCSDSLPLQAIRARSFMETVVNNEEEWKENGSTI